MIFGGSNATLKAPSSVCGIQMLERISTVGLFYSLSLRWWIFISLWI